MWKLICNNDLVRKIDEKSWEIFDRLSEEKSHINPGDLRLFTTVKYPLLSSRSRTLGNSFQLKKIQPVWQLTAAAIRSFRKSNWWFFHGGAFTLSPQLTRTVSSWLKSATSPFSAMANNNKAKTIRRQRDDSSWKRGEKRRRLIKRPKLKSSWWILPFIWCLT